MAKCGQLEARARASHQDIVGFLGQTNRLECWAGEWLPAEGHRGCPVDAVQLLCRALQLTPSCYRRFQLAHDQPDKPLEVSGRMWLAAANRFA